MKTLYCNVNFMFSEKFPDSKMLRKLMQETYIKQRRKLVDVLNSGNKFERWNREFDRTHTWYDGIYESDEYNKFMQKKQQKYADLVNDAYMPWWFELYITPENDIGGRLKFYKDATVEVTICNLREEL